MRRKHISKRQSTIPEDRLPEPVRLWQLHTEDGHALNILHREQAGPHGFLRPPVDEEVVQGSYCLMPTWGGRHRPLVKPGMVWKCIREYVPDHRPFPPGRVSKTPVVPYGKVHGKAKRWKFEYTRGAKVYRARKLGFEYRQAADHVP
jgi:hypothetical protein